MSKEIITRNKINEAINNQNMHDWFYGKSWLISAINGLIKLSNFQNI